MTNFLSNLSPLIDNRRTGRSVKHVAGRLVVLPRILLGLRLLPCFILLSRRILLRRLRVCRAVLPGLTVGRLGRLSVNHIVLIILIALPVLISGCLRRLRVCCAVLLDLAVIGLRRCRLIGRGLLPGLLL